MEQDAQSFSQLLDPLTLEEPNELVDLASNNDVVDDDDEIDEDNPMVSQISDDSNDSLHTPPAPSLNDINLHSTADLSPTSTLKSVPRKDPMQKHLIELVKIVAQQKKRLEDLEKQSTQSMKEKESNKENTSSNTQNKRNVRSRSRTGRSSTTPKRSNSTTKGTKRKLQFTDIEDENNGQGKPKRKSTTPNKESNSNKEIKSNNNKSVNSLEDKNNTTSTPQDAPLPDLPAENIKHKRQALQRNKGERGEKGEKEEKETNEKNEESNKNNNNNNNNNNTISEKETVTNSHYIFL